MRMRVILTVALLAVGMVSPPSVHAAAASHPAESGPRAGWSWPVAEPAVIVAPYVQPAHRYAAGHRGVDLAATAEVIAPAAGAVAFAGLVAGRPVLTIRHEGDLVTTLEPVSTPLKVGDVVLAGDVVGAVASGGHAPPGSVHWGVRLAGEYINPLVLVGDVPPAVLLPCC